MGGYDIYRFDLHSTGSEAVNLCYPVNSTDNDLFYFPGSNKYQGYLSRFTVNGFGDRDIYAVEIHPAIHLTGKIIPDNQSANIDTGSLLITIMDLNTYQMA